jgi:hypothetical protein
MATKQTNFFKGNARVQIPYPDGAGDEVSVMFTHIFTDGSYKELPTAPKLCSLWGQCLQCTEPVLCLSRINHH